MKGVLFCGIDMNEFVWRALLFGVSFLRWWRATVEFVEVQYSTRLAKYCSTDWCVPRNKYFCVFGP